MIGGGMAEEIRLLREGLVSCVRMPGEVRLEYADGRVVWLENAVTELVLTALHGPTGREVKGE